jgi:hypothetical protein
VANSHSSVFPDTANACRAHRSVTSPRRSSSTTSR